MREIVVAGENDLYPRKSSLEQRNSSGLIFANASLQTLVSLPFFLQQF